MNGYGKIPPNKDKNGKQNENIFRPITSVFDEFREVLGPDHGENTPNKKNENLKKCFGSY